MISFDVPDIGDRFPRPGSLICPCQVVPGTEKHSRRNLGPGLRGDRIGAGLLRGESAGMLFETGADLVREPLAGFVLVEPPDPADVDPGRGPRPFRGRNGEGNPDRGDAQEQLDAGLQRPGPVRSPPASGE